MASPGGPFKEHRDGVLIDIRVQPGSTRRGVEGTRGGRISVFVHSSPHEGRANREAIKVLSKALGLAASSLDIIRGSKSREKTILARGISVADATSLLQDRA